MLQLPPLSINLRQFVEAMGRERRKGRAYQPLFRPSQVALAWCGGVVAITLLGLLSAWSRYPLLIAPLGASSVLLFGYPSSPLAQPRNLVLGNATGAAVAVVCVDGFGPSPWVMGLAVGLTIAFGQWLRCLHPPAGGVALLGVLLQARPGFVLFPVVCGSLVLVVMAVAFSRCLSSGAPYPRHWL